MPKISVITPCYNVAPFVERCVRSLLEQTMEDVQYIFVNDASPDNSWEIVSNVAAEYPQREVLLISHTGNKGVCTARNTGLAAATGDFIFHCDADDYLEPTMLEKMYRAAMEQDADYIYCDYYLDFESGRRYMHNPSFSDPERLVKEGFLAGTMKYNLWNKLVRRDLYYHGESLTFAEGYAMGDDMILIILAMRAKRCAHVAEALYHYIRINTNSITSTASEHHLAAIRHNTGRVLEALSIWNVPDRDLYAQFFKLNVKLPFLFTGRYSQYRLWCEWFPEADKYIAKNRHWPFRTRLVQLFARCRLFPLVWLNWFATERIYYGIVKRLGK